MRRWALSFGAVAAAAALILPAAVASASPTPLATVNMEMVVLAAQVDPPKYGTGITPGAGSHVTQVEQALDTKGFLAPRYVDGHFGTATLAAYADWQESLGYSGIDANGVPGRTSLSELGQGRFSVVRTFSVGSRESHDGEQLNNRTDAMLHMAEDMVGWDLPLTQGSYTCSNPDSAGTHCGGGALDISVRYLSTTQRWKSVEALRVVGFAAWLRTPSQGPWAYHIHAIAVSDTDASRPARDQVHDYYYGRNGLANHAPDNTPESYRPGFTWWEKFQRS